MKQKNILISVSEKTFNLIKNEREIIENYHRKNNYKTVWCGRQQISGASKFYTFDDIIDFIEDNEVCISNSVFFFDRDDYIIDFLDYFCYNQKDIKHNNLFYCGDNELENIYKVRKINIEKLIGALTSPLNIFQIPVLPYELNFLKGCSFVYPNKPDVNISEIEHVVKGKGYTFISDFNGFFKQNFDVTATSISKFWDVLESYTTIWGIKKNSSQLICISNGIRKNEIRIVDVTSKASKKTLLSIPNYKSGELQQFSLSCDEKKTIRKINENPEDKAEALKLLGVPDEYIEKLFPELSYPPKSEIKFENKTLIFSAYNKKVKLQAKHFALYQFFYNTKPLSRAQLNADKYRKRFLDIYGDLDNSYQDRDEIVEKLFDESKTNFVEDVSKIRKQIRSALYSLSNHYAIERDDNGRYRIPYCFDK